MNWIFRISVLLMAALLTACGTTYSVPEAGEGETSTATKMFAEARAAGPRAALPPTSAERRFRRVAARIEPAGRKVCETSTAEIKGFNCNVNIAIDYKMQDRNAYFTYAGKDPQIRISMPLLRDTASDDEVAFVLSHEFGHLIGRHIEKQRQQAIVGALIMGTITAAANANAAANGQYYDPNAVSRNMEIGAAAGTLAYSQTYELESDTLGTYIAQMAGYDPVKGAKFFARPEDARTSSGKLSFWGTHPPDEKRLATVLAAVKQIEANNGLVLKKAK